MRVIYPYFMVWTRAAAHTIRVQLNAMRCKRLGHKQLIGVWNDTQQKHIAFCVACMTLQPNAEVPDVFKREISV